MEGGTADGRVPPAELRTERLLLRRWRPRDAALLKAALDSSVDHLKPWIPWRIAEPAPVPELEGRLAAHAEDFDAGREWLWGIFSPDGAAVLGGVGLYPRAASGRVPFAEADHIEIGYWLTAGATGRGWATEAARAVLGVALALPGMTRVEIRCDPRNAPSAALPPRLGFRHARTVPQSPATAASPPRELMIWERAVG
jgi:RimJ/RimL family protein N-acetyltransferase